MGSTIPLSEIVTLTLLYKLRKLSPPSSLQPGATSKHNDRISLIRHDITKLEVDSIVNAANESLLGGGGVDGAIHSAAGPELVEECRTLDGCNTGEAKITGAYDLPCKKVIHAVGPVYGSAKRKGMHSKLLSSCYTKSLDLAVENGCRSIAFSALSTGVYGYPSKEAAETAIGAVKGWLDEDEDRATKIERVVFCSFLQKDESAYEEYIPQFFPPTDAEQQSEDGNGGEVSEDAKTTTDSAALDLPDVPTKEPTEDGQSQPKRQKLSDDSKEQG